MLCAIMRLNMIQGASRPKKLLVVVSVALVLLVLVSLAFILARGREQSVGFVSAIPIEGNKQLVRQSLYGVSVEIPVDWRVVAFSDGRGGVEAYGSSNSVDAQVSLYKIPNVSGLSPDEIVQASEGQENISRINSGSVAGIEQVTKVLSEDVPERPESVDGVIEESYLLIRKFFIGDSIVSVSCALVGAGYTDLIPVCREIVQSVAFDGV